MKTITVRKGLDINLMGKPKPVLREIISEFYAIKPTDFHGVLPKLLVAEGDNVKIGTHLFFDKHNEAVKFTAPVSGTIHKIRRGAKRLLEEIVIKADDTEAHVDVNIPDLSVAGSDQIIELLLDLGLWPFIRQRPYKVIANPEEKPKGVFVSAFDTAPLAPDYDFLIKDQGPAFQVGLDVLKKISQAPVHLSLHSEKTKSTVFLNAADVNIHRFKGPHPTGNAGIQIHYINPINKGDVVWVVNAIDVATIGKLFLNKGYDTSRIVAITGSEVKSPAYYKTRIGAGIKSVVEKEVEDSNNRYISGNVLTGTKIRRDGYVGFYDHMITVIPEGDNYDFMGWIKPGFKSFSFSNLFPSKFLYKKPWRLDTNLNSGVRAFVVTGQYEKVFPMDIFPVHLIKAILIEDIELMENLGIYEVDEEDLALCEVICTSKTEVQTIIRQGLDLIRKEMS